MEYPISNLFRHTTNTKGQFQKKSYFRSFLGSFNALSVIKFLLIVGLFGSFSLIQSFVHAAPSSDLGIVGKLLDNNTTIVNSSVLRYQINYYNNRSTSASNTKVSALLPDGLTLIDTDNPVYTVQTGLQATKYGTSGDVCYAELLNETGAYFQALNQWAQGQGAPDIHTLLLNLPGYKDYFLMFPYSGQYDMIGEFVDGAVAGFRGGV